MLDDGNGAKKLCIAHSEADGKTNFSIDTDSTIKNWEEFTEASVKYYGFSLVAWMRFVRITSKF